MPYVLFSAAWCGCYYMDLCKVHPLEWTLEKLLGLTDEILRGAFLMAIKGHFGIQDKDRMKRWMRKYREQGEFGLLDQRGCREEYIDPNRCIQKLKRENGLLKKCLKIRMREERKNASNSLNKQLGQGK